ncbi:hypothetical protein C8F01DRAFT_1227975 [Mycena amicta]|nr:hypothetical protein C8F01DRAFT_1227975 [Mycena amicta]
MGEPGPSTQGVDYARSHGFPKQSTDYARLLTAYESERAKLNRLRDTLEGRFIELRKGESRLKEKWQKMESDAGKMKELLDASARRENAAKGELDAAHKEKSRLQETLDASRADRLSADRSLTVARSESLSLRSSLAACNDEVNRRRAEIVDLRLQITQAAASEVSHTKLLRTRLEDSKEKAQIARQETAETKTMLQQVLEREKALNERRSQLETEMEKTKALLNQSLDRGKDATEKLSVLETEKSVLQQKLETTEADASTAKESLLTVEIEVLELRAKVADLDGRRRRRDAEIQKLGTFIAALETTNATSVAAKDEMVKQVAEAKDHLRRAEERESALLVQLTEVNAEKAALQEDLEARKVDSDTSLAAAQSETREVRSEAQRLLRQQQSEIAELQKHASEANARFQALQSSVEAEKAKVLAANKSKEEDVATSKAVLQEASERENTIQRELTEAKTALDHARRAAKTAAVEAKSSLAQVESEARDLRAQVTGLKQQLHQRGSERERLNSVVTNLSEKLKAKTAEATALKLKQQFAEKLESPETPIKATVDSRAQKRIVELEAENSELRTTNQNLNGTIMKLAADVTKELESSWESQRAELTERIATLEAAQQQKKQGKTVGDPANLKLKNQLVQEATRSQRLRSARTKYNTIMNACPDPPGRPPFKELVRVQATQTAHQLRDAATPRSSRLSLYLPKRTVWCGVERVHMLAFAPTLYYGWKKDEWVPNTELIGKVRVGREFDVFVNSGEGVYYAGIYRVLSFRVPGERGHGTESEIPSEIAKHAVIKAMGFHIPQEKIDERFPDGELRVECFGLQCVGFDAELYAKLRDFWLETMAKVIASAVASRTTDPRRHPEPPRPDATRTAGVKRKRQEEEEEEEEEESSGLEEEGLSSPSSDEDSEEEARPRLRRRTSYNTRISFPFRTKA